MASTSTIRPLGCCEIFSSSRHAFGAYTCVCNTCRYTPASSAAQSTASLTDLLENAVAQVITQLASLRVGIVGQHTTNPCFTRLDSVDLRNHIQWRKADDDAGLLRIIESQHDQFWPDIERRPPWAIIAVERQDDAPAIDIVFAVHHSISDGLSTTIFHRHLLQALNRPCMPAPGLKNHILTLPEKGSVMAPSLEEMVKFSISWPFFFRVLWQEFAPAWLRGDSAAPPWTGKPTTMQPRDACMRLITIPEGILGKILAACRANGATITSLLHALILTSLSRRLPRGLPAAFASTTPISLRSLAQENSSIDLANTLSVLVTVVKHEFTAGTIEELQGANLQSEEGNRAVWKAAQQVKAMIKERVEAIPQDDIMGLLAWVKDWQKRWEGLLGKPRDATWEVSNLGSVNMAQDDGTEPAWKVERSVFSQPATVFGSAFSVNVSGVRSCGVSISVTWQNEIVETSLVEDLVGDVDSWLKCIGETGGLNQ